MGLDFLRPVLDEAQPLNITFGITLQQIIDVVSCPQQIKDTFNKLILPRLIKPLNANTNSNKNTNTSTNTTKVGRGHYHEATPLVRRRALLGGWR